ncbi:MAG: hypothetical protein HN413_01095 [Chloroflexi bacterium]|jgi:hypothetical protein|nr:hypothetical protein [Chloroflexota bacterium]
MTSSSQKQISKSDRHITCNRCDYQGMATVTVYEQAPGQRFIGWECPKCQAGHMRSLLQKPVVEKPD